MKSLYQETSKSGNGDFELGFLVFLDHPLISLGLFKSALQNNTLWAQMCQLQIHLTFSLENFFSK